MRLNLNHAGENQRHNVWLTPDFNKQETIHCEMTRSTVESSGTISAMWITVKQAVRLLVYISLKPNAIHLALFSFALARNPATSRTEIGGEKVTKSTMMHCFFPPSSSHFPSVQCIWGLSIINECVMNPQRRVWANNWTVITHDLITHTGSRLAEAASERATLSSQKKKKIETVCACDSSIILDKQ